MTQKRILFVDDEPLVLQGLQRMLHQMRSEWEMVFAEGGEAALGLMDKSHFDVVVSDMRMPGMNGAQLLQEVMRRHPATIRLVLSGHADRDLVSQCVGVAHQYIGKPCEASHLKSMIQHAFALSANLESEEVKRIIGSIVQLPSAPDLYQRLREAMADEHATTKALGDIIERDMGMTSIILKLVNSAFFGLRRIIDTPHEAVAYLGVDTIRTLVLTHGIFLESNGLETHGLSLEELWRHSLDTANCACAIAATEGLDRAAQEAAFVGGILHDVGILVLAASFPEVYDRAIEIATQEHLHITMAEQRLFHLSHTEVGTYLLGLWGIPDATLEIIRKHHRPPSLFPPGLTPALAVRIAEGLVGERTPSALFFGPPVQEADLEIHGLTGHLDTWRALLGPVKES
nr:response regulator [uncultured Holophaga sp.]